MNNQKGFANIILIVVIVAIVAVGGYFVFSKKSEPITQQTSPTPTQTETPISQTPTPKNETANWKAYTNTKYGFEIKYPVSWTYDCVGQPCDSTWWIWLNSSKDRPEIQIAIKVRDLVKPILTAEEYFKKESFLEVISKDWTKIDGNSAFGGIVKIGRGEAGVSAERFLMVVKDSRLYQFELIERQDNEKLDLSKMPILDQILSTFKFIK